MDIIFCGLLREPDRFKKSLNDLIQLQKEGVVGKIILSTWYNWRQDMKQKPQRWRFLLDLLTNIKVVESSEPDVHPNMIWHQMKSLEVGLDNTKSKYILKTRTDVYIDPDFIRGLEENCGNKIWIPWYQRVHPFYMADECFYGPRDKIENLVNYCEDYDNKYKVEIAPSHVRRWAHSYGYDILRQHMDGLITDNALLTHYYSMLKKWFYVHPGGIEFRWFSGKNIKKKGLDFCCDMKPIEEYERMVSH